MTRRGDEKMKIIQWAKKSELKWHNEDSQSPIKTIKQLRKTAKINQENSWTPDEEKIIYRIKTI